MSQQEHAGESAERRELPIERGFPVERVNEIAEREGRAKRYYRPVYTMHKWWARRPGCLFRAVSLYSLLDDQTEAGDIEVYEPGESRTLGDDDLSEESLVEAVGEVDMDDPESLWEFYPKDVRVADKKILDPFMGGGTSLVEASRFGAETVGYDLNPVAWFVTKKQLEAGRTSVEDLERAFERVEDDVADELSQYYETPCPNSQDHGNRGGDSHSDHDGDDHGHDADVMYNFWVKELDCVSCGHAVPLFKDYRVAKERYADDPGYHVLCPDCGELTVVDSWRSESACGECDHEFVPEDGNVNRGGYYTCPECGRKETIRDGIAQTGKPTQRLYAVEYYCEACEEAGAERSEYKGYKAAGAADRQLFEEAKREWQARTDLRDYVPDDGIPRGAKTVSSAVDGPDVFERGYESWTDMFNERQLLSLAKLLRSIDSVADSDVRDYLLLAFSDSLMFQNTFTIYNKAANKIEGIFRMNSFGPQTDFVENNVWGTEAGRGTFRNTWEKLLAGVEYSNSPTDRYVSDGQTVETSAFAQSIGRNAEIRQGDMRNLSERDEYDAVITDPPYYDNIIYSDLSDFFYVWQKVLLEDEYPGFDRDQTPSADSIVTNPYLDKSAEDFEHEMSEALAVVRRALKDDGVLAFTYHHSDEESWGELLESLCRNDFEVTATYPINSDLNKFISGEAVAFDIVIVARPTDERTPISWNSLRRRIVKTAQETHETLTRNRDLTTGDVGVVEMGKCFQEYSKHHGEVRRAGDVMSAKEVVDEIYGIIQDGERGEQDIYLDLLETDDPSYDDLNKHLKRSDASEETMKEMELFRTEGGDFVLSDWADEKRQAYVQRKVEEETDVTDLDRAHFLRYRYEHDRSRSEYVGRWDVDELRELCEDLAAVTGDETYLKMLGVDTTLAELSDE